ncbi:MAG TPA: Na+/H+ antiporter NhaC [Verrucomicrobiales bacterium]|nr:Na+/H+ antiporter NhaC [Verrucomicrobiales bacterium]
MAAPDQPPRTSASNSVRLARLWEALIPVGALIVMIYVSVVQLEAYAHLALLLAAAVASGVGLRIGHTWKSIEEGMVEGIAVGLKAILILLVIGILIATWIQSGIVPLLIYHGLNLLSPSIFLAATCLICSVVSVATGSSWTTAGTVGVALIGVGQGLGMPLPMVAGAIISGAYFGDKLSPLSDTTNLAPAVAGSELFEHVRYMLHTTVPGLVIAVVLYVALGIGRGGSATLESVQVLREALAAAFNLHPVLLLPPLLVIVMVVFKLPALPALLGGALLGAGLAAGFQGNGLKEIVSVAFDGYVSETGNAAVDELLSRGGLMSMMNTVALIVCALGFGGVMERTGQLAALANAVLKLARNTGSLVATTVFTCFGMNVLAPDQYLSIVVPGRMYREAYDRAGLEPRLLSRTLEDAGTLSSPLIGWNTCGAFMSTTLGVSALAYAPYAFLNLACPIIAIVLATAGWGIVRKEKGQARS